MRLVLFPFLLVIGLLAGCSSVSTEGRAELGKYRRVFVEQRLNDNFGVDRALTAELQALGYVAAAGPLTMMPDDTELIVTYDAREAWDFRSYLIELRVGVHPIKNYNAVMKTARYYQPGVRVKPAEQVAQELVRKLFPATR